MKGGTCKKMKDKAWYKRICAVFMAFVMMLAMTACTGGTGADKASVDSVVDDCAARLLEITSEPVYGSIGGEWVVFGLARWGGEVPEEWYENYYEQLEAYIVSCNGVLDSRKYTEYSRVILALTAMGKDPTNVGGYNLLEPLADFEQTIFQGLNGPLYALLALDSGDYEIPSNTAGTTQATRQMYVDYILSREVADGGWSLAGGTAEIDMTAMVLQALAKYQDQNEVKEATERALTVLSQQQNDDGTYTSYDMESSESIAQVIVALTELGISIDDSRFVKNDITLEESLLGFMTEDGQFRHIMEGEADQMATEQAFYALVSLARVENGKTSVYDMSDLR